MSKISRIGIAACGLLIVASPVLAASTKRAGPRAKLIAGWLEKVTVAATGQVVKAKLDSGAKTSSIHATDVVEIERHGAPWVRFALPGMDGPEIEPVVIERPVVRFVRIKDHTNPSARRPIVELEICFDSRRRRSHFSLADRRNFHYPVLLGRRFLAGVAVVDASEKYVTDPKCPVASGGND